MLALRTCTPICGIAAAAASKDTTLLEGANPARWLRLIRTGTTLTAYSSSTGSTWTKIGSDVIALGTTAYVGLAVTSHSQGLATSAAVSNVSVNSLSLPAPQ